MKLNMVVFGERENEDNDCDKQLKYQGVNDVALIIHTTYKYKLCTPFRPRVRARMIDSSPLSGSYSRSSVI